MIHKKCDDEAGRTFEIVDKKVMNIKKRVRDGLIMDRGKTSCGVHGMEDRDGYQA